MTAEAVDYPHSELEKYRQMWAMEQYAEMSPAMMFKEYIAKDIALTYWAKSLLDVGVGSGQILQFVRERFPQLELHGTDIIPEVPAWGMEGGEFTVAPAHAMPFEDKAFDIVLCCDVLEHVLPPFLDKSIVEVGRVCRETLIITVPTFASHGMTWGKPEVGKLHQTVRDAEWWRKRIRVLLVSDFLQMATGLGRGGRDVYLCFRREGRR